MSDTMKFAGTGVLAVILLAGCATVPVESPNGEGFCDADPVTLAVTQDEIGNNISIDYTGPSDVSLLFNRSSYYFEFDELLAANNGEVSFTVDGNTPPAIVKFNPANPANPGWTPSSVDGGLVNWAFDGDIDELLTGVPVPYESPGWENRVTPATIAVSCDASLSTVMEFTDTDPATANVVDGLGIAVAQALYPRHSRIDTVEIIGQEVVDGNLVIDFRFAPGTAERFHEFSLGAGSVGIVPVDLPEGTPQIGSETFEGAWFNFVTSCLEVDPSSSTFCIPAMPSAWTFDGTNEWIIPGVSSLIDGEYLGVFLLVDDPDIENQVINDARIAFTSFTYDSVNGFAIQDLTEQTVEDNENLAATGGDASVIIIAILGALAVAAAFDLRLRRRQTIKQD